MGGALSTDIMADIARPYKVARGLPSRGNPNGDKVVAAVNEAAQDWPSGLIDRAELCASVVSGLVDNGGLNNNQVSAISKLFWFVRPEKWTLFDRYVAQGMWVGHERDGINRMKVFYARLEASGFDAVHDQIERIVGSSDWSSMSAARIIDAFLMRRGGFDSGVNSTVSLRHFSEALPSGAKVSLTHVAEQLQREVGNEILRENRN